MKKFVSIILSMTMLAALFTSFTITSYADDIENTIKGSKSSSLESTSMYCPSVNDIKSTGDDKVIQLPKSSSYFSEYVRLYVDVPKALCSYVYTKPNADSKAMPFAYQGSKLIGLAKEGKFYCVRYITDDNVFRTGWIHENNVSSVFPGDMYYYGDSRQTESCLSYGDALVSWSKTPFVGTKINYTVIEALPFGQEACRGMTIEYKVTGKNGDVSGDRDVYLNGGDGWVYIGNVVVNKNLSPIRLELNFDEPTVVKAVAIVPSNPDNDDFTFRQCVVDILY